jgi:Na+-transporting methylmalonyl-CoA/oxaloacetate decarboxylase gamma subunit
MNIFTLNRFALALRPDGTYEPFSAEAWKFAGQMTLMGMGMIFAVLALLWLVLAIFKLIFVGKSQKTPKVAKALKQETKPSAPTDAPDDAIAAVIAASIRAIQEDEAQQMVAVITAAVAAYRAEEGSTGEFRVVSFKRAGSARSWNKRK